MVTTRPPKTIVEPTALGPVANTDAKLLIYRLFQKGRVLAQDGVSLSKYVAACERVIEAAGLSPELHANGTNIEGDWDEVFCVVKRCHEVVHEMGAPRIHTNIKLGTRADRSQTMKNKITSVTSKK